MNKDVGVFLKHYGVKGMKWGVRKGDKTANMSNKELQSKIQRMRLEDQYKSLSKKRVSKGRKIVSKAISHIGERAAKRYANNKVDEYVDKVSK